MIEEIPLPNEIFKCGKGGEPKVIKQRNFFGTIGNEGIGSFHAFLQHIVHIGKQVVEGKLLIYLFEFPLEPIVSEVDEGVEVDVKFLG